ncbi:RraA family protein [Streptosporangium amethystogenes subsp. fukuiense]|uniref:Putative 4-hydroxy-4-methyl-2-oxoglutarate aldolase n=1 Tax=Streptosporangium amethystogenes subsp. fukuiense TaxID=698418 RepID=A0ABW2TAZ6_9ACTN
MTAATTGVVTAELVREAAALPAATLHEAAGKIGALPAAIGPVRPGMRVAGPALPVLSPPGDNLWLHRAIYAAEPGDVLVVAFGDGADPLEYGHWGEVMAVAALHRGIAGLVTSGGVRDGDQMAERGFPVFAPSLCIRGTGKDPDGRGSVGAPVRIGGVTVRRGDLVVADGDGVVVLPVADAAGAVRAAARREAAEQEIFDRLAAGETSLDIYRLPAEGES